jgi:hypothetical protein
MRKPIKTMSIMFKPFEISTPGCIYGRFEYDFSMQTPNGAYQALPGWIIQDPALIQLNITVSDFIFAGEYLMQLSGTLNPYLYAVHQFKLIVETPPNEGPPYFAQPITSPLKVYLLVKNKVKFPAIKDPDNDKGSMSLVYFLKGIAQPALPNFIIFNARSLNMAIYPTELEEVGIHSFRIYLDDDHKYPQRRTVPLVIEVVRYTPQQLLFLEL